MDAITSTSPAPNATGTEQPSHLWANGEMSFHDVLDAVNPLQHIPVVSAIYRAVTGDKIGNVARVVGDTLYGGAVGFVFGMANAGMVSETGKDLGEHLEAFAKGDPDEINREQAPFQGDEFTHGTPALFGSAKRKAEQAAASAAAQRQTPPQEAAPTVATPKTTPPVAATIATPNQPQKPGPIDLPYFPDSFGKPLIGANDPVASAATVPALSNANTAAAPATADGQKAAKVAQIYQASAAATKPGTPSAEAVGTPPSGIPVAPPPSTGIALPTGNRFIAIDTTKQGIANQRAASAQHASVPVAFTPPSGTISNAVHSPAPVSSIDFADRMRQGLDKYNALVQSRTGKRPPANEQTNRPVDQTS